MTKMITDRQKKAIDLIGEVQSLRSMPESQRSDASDKSHNLSVAETIVTLSDLDSKGFRSGMHGNVERFVMIIDHAEEEDLLGFVDALKPYLKAMPDIVPRIINSVAYSVDSINDGWAGSSKMLDLKPVSKALKNYYSKERTPDEVVNWLAHVRLERT